MKEKIRHWIFGHKYYWHGCIKENGKVKSWAHWECACGRSRVDLWPEKDHSVFGSLIRILS